MMLLDSIVLGLVILLLQLPVFYMVGLRDKEISRLNGLLLRVDRPAAAAVAEAPARIEKTQAERAAERLAVEERHSLWAR